MAGQKRDSDSRFLATLLATRSAVTLLFGLCVFYGSPFISLAICYAIYRSRFWPFLFAYLAWMVYDWNTPKEKGRQWQRCKNLPAWRWIMDYFPSKLIKCGDLDPTKNYIFNFCPHGIFSVGSIFGLGTNSLDFNKLYTGLTNYPLTLPFAFWFPFVREALIAFGVRVVSKEVIVKLVSQPEGGNAVIMSAAGGNEAFDAKPGKSIVRLKNRKGFVKLALQTGACLVPVYVFGENELYHQVEFAEGSVIKLIQGKVKAWTGLAPVFTFGKFLFLPYQIPLTIVCGKPLDVPKTEHPTDQQIEEFHKKFIEALTNLFNEYKKKYNVDPDAVLTIA